MLLIAAEAQTALGRTGTMYAFERDGVVPDLLTLSKTLGAGLPVAAVATSRDIEISATTEVPVLHHPRLGPDHRIDHTDRLWVIERDGLVERARRLGEQVRDRLENLHGRYDLISDVRGRGLLQGMELTGDHRNGLGAEAVGRAVTQQCLARPPHRLPTGAARAR